MRAHFISICQRKQTWGRTTCWSNTAQAWRVVTGFGWVWGVGVTPDEAEIEHADAKRHLCRGTWGAQRAFMGNHLSSLLIEQRAGTQHQDNSLQIKRRAHTVIIVFVCQTVPVMIMLICRVLKSSEGHFVYFLWSFWNMLYVSGCHQDTGNLGYTWMSPWNSCILYYMLMFWVSSTACTGDLSAHAHIQFPTNMWVYLWKCSLYYQCVQRILPC